MGEIGFQYIKKEQLGAMNGQIDKQSRKGMPLEVCQCLEVEVE